QVFAQVGIYFRGCLGDLVYGDGDSAFHLLVDVSVGGCAMIDMEAPFGPVPDDVADDGLEVRLAERLRGQGAGKLSAEELRDRIRSAIPRCLEYDLTTEDQMLQFVQATLLLGEDFDSGPEGDWAV